MFGWNLCEYIFTVLSNQRPLCSNVYPVKCKYRSKDILLFYSSHLQPSRPLSWSYDSSQALSAQLTPNHTIPSTQSNYSLGRGSRGRPSPLTSRPESPSHSVLGASNSKSSLVSSEGMDTTVCTDVNRDDSCDAFEVNVLIERIIVLQSYLIRNDNYVLLCETCKKMLIVKKVMISWQCMCTFFFEQVNHLDYWFKVVSHLFWLLDML